MAINMKKLVKITKIKICEDAEYRTPDWDEYELGKINGNMSLPVDYYLEGYLLEEIKVGKPVLVERISRNGEKIGGFFSTSFVREISYQENKNQEGGCWFFKTLNSIYRMDYIM